MMKKTLSLLMAAFLALNTAGTCALTVRAESAAATAEKESGASVQTAEWKLKEDENGSCYLVSPLFTGSIHSAEGKDYYAFLQAFIDQDVLLFKTYSNSDYQEGIYNHTDSYQRMSALVYTESGVFSEVDVIFYPNSNQFYLDPVKTVGGLTISQLIELDLRTGGRTQLCITTDSWNGGHTSSYAICRFVLSADSGQFISLLNEATERNWGSREGATRTERHIRLMPQIDNGWRKVRPNSKNGVENPDIFLFNLVHGYGISNKGIEQANALLYENYYGLTLFLNYWNGTNWVYWNYPGDEAGFPIGIRTSAGEYMEVSADVTPGEAYIFLPYSESEEEISADDLILQEILNNGIVELQLSVPGWNGNTDENTTLYFTVPAYDGSFNSLYAYAEEHDWSETLSSNEMPVTETEAPTEPAKAASVYSDETIQQVCSNYLNTFNYAVPICAQLYDTIMSDSATFLDYALAFAGGISSAQALIDFYNAKSVFDNISWSDMTVDQQTLYTQTKTAVDSTKAGQIIKLIDMLYKLGLL